MNYTDPTGHCPMCIGAAIGALVGGAIGAYASYRMTGSVQWEAVVGGAIGGALIGTGIGYLAEIAAAPAAMGEVMAAQAEMTESAISIGMDVSTNGASTVLWSGPGNMELATQFALENNGMTLGMTEYGQALQASFDAGEIVWEEAAPLWRIASEKFAEQAVGTVDAFIQGSSESSIFWTVEYPTLFENATPIMFH